LGLSSAQAYMGCDMRVEYLRPMIHYSTSVAEFQGFSRCGGVVGRN